MSTELELKEELLALLSNDEESIDENIDYGRLLALSNAIAKHDQNNVRFSVDAKIIDRLGQQLVAKKTTALSELIKNAYDADSSLVTVEFLDTNAPDGTVVIFDNGTGMSREQLIDGFMTISTSDKVRNPKSEIYERVRAGKKGIGRFSTQKIGKELELVTKRESDSKYLRLIVNWDDFESEQSLDSVSNQISYIEGGHSFVKGTQLRILKAREAWTESNIKTTYNYISSILQTPSKSTDRKDPGFDVHFTYIDSTQASKTLKEINANTEFIDKADLKAVATMNSNGYLEIKVEGYRDDISTETLTFDEGYNEKLLNSGFKVELLYFSREKGSPRSKALLDYLQNNGGVKLFRNGFNVAPYGGRYDDWLGLQESTQKRKILPPHSNTNYVGHVSITDPDDSILEETSAREGVIENEAFDLLVEATHSVAIKIASHVASTRGKKVTANQTGYVSEKKSKEDAIKAELEELRKKVQQQAQEQKDQTSKENNDSTDTSTQTDGTTNKGDKSDEETPGFNAESILDGLDVVSQKLEEYIDEQLMYRVLSSTGLAISEFTHEIQTCLTNLNMNSQTLDELKKTNPKIINISEQLEENLSMLTAYTDFFDGTMRSNSNREKNHYDMRKLIKKFVKAMEPTTQRKGYMLTTHFDTWGIWSKRIHISEVMSILINLFTNACKAIERAGKKGGHIHIDVSTSSQFMTIKFEDNGDGIPNDKWAEVFTPLYTTAMPVRRGKVESEYTRGMGLGLTITEQIIIEMNGEIAVSEPSNDFKTCIKILLPLADESELPEDAY
ncbi:histidine kinase [Vibrio crassostreae]|nr:histidine kinase [Vibrio crassostreae]CAK2232713.1 histidine kinase [Vibrio crassostreae]CAK3090383.1 histidine kinase [Vibrio crassostreae]CAK3573508.1 histidine kinase [Vibrio crassostreae]CAK4010760.1 histidine kinase [Vibrio crassostreae]